MCRNIRTLFNFDPPATPDEIHAASLQFVRKVTGFNKPSQANEKAFDQAVNETCELVKRLFTNLTTQAAPKDREVEAAKAKARAAKRFAKN